MNKIIAWAFWGIITLAIIAFLVGLCWLFIDLTMVLMS